MKGIKTFKQRCVEKGIYKNAIASNDWEHSTTGFWVVTIPYGQKNGGLQKVFKRFSGRDIENAAKFWFNNVDKQATFNY